MKKKLLAIFTACLFSALFVLGGCAPSSERPGGGEDDEFGLATTIDSNRTTLFVSNFNGGFGERMKNSTRMTSMRKGKRAFKSGSTIVKRAVRIRLPISKAAVMLSSSRSMCMQAIMLTAARYSIFRALLPILLQNTERRVLSRTR